MVKTKLKLLKKRAKAFFAKTKSVKCPAFPKEKVYFNSKGLSHLFYKGARKVFSRPNKDSEIRVYLLPRAVKILTLMPLVQETSSFEIHRKIIKYWAFEAVADNRRIKVIVRQVGHGRKHFWSVIPAWRRARGKIVNARGNLNKL